MGKEVAFAGLDSAPPKLERYGLTPTVEAPRGARVRFAGSGNSGPELRAEGHLAQLPATSPAESLESVRPPIAATYESQIAVVQA